MPNQTSHSKNFAATTAELVRMERARRRLSQGEVAQMAGVGVSRVGEIERGDLTVGVQTLEKVAGALGLRLALEAANAEDAVA